MTRRSAPAVLLGLALLGWIVPPTRGAQDPERQTRNVIFVMADGLRWQEVFGGADRALIDQGRPDSAEAKELRREFWRETAASRRAALLPFLWTVIAKNGQIYGNRDLGSDAYVTNGMNFSYPGYNEILCGFPDPRIDSNDKKPNPNVSVLEWLHRKPAYAGKVAAFGAWDVFPFILNAGRSEFLVNAGFDPLMVEPVTPRIELLNELKPETAVLDVEALDAITFHTALEYFKLHKPRVLFVSLGETDEWAHAGKYDLYLKSARLFDQSVKEIWEAAQSMPEYRSATSLILAVDHGRGLAPVDWKSHGQKIPDSKYVWMAFLGPDTPAMGERSTIPAVTESQVAPTLAALLGEDYQPGAAQAGKPITDVLRH
jgi:hypothetical protein